MTKAPITGGVAEYSRSRKVADYENKSARISFNVGEGEDAEKATVHALALAMAYVHRALGLVDELASDAGTVTTTAGNLQVNSAVAEKPKGKPKKAPTPPATEKTASEITDALAIEGGAGLPQIRTNGEDRKPVEEDPAALFTAQAEDVTDKQLSDAVTRKNAALIPVHKDAGPPMIRKLIGKYVKAGQQMYQIPQSARAGFLSALEELK